MRSPSFVQAALVIGGCLICTSLFFSLYMIYTVKSLSTFSLVSREPLLVLQTATEENKLPDVNIISVPPSKMKVHYYEMWNHTTQTIEVPDKYRNPFNVSVEDKITGKKRRPLTNLEILQNVLHGEKYQAEFKAVERYMASEKGNVLVPQCLAPDIKATEELTGEIIKTRNKMQKQKQRRKLNGKKLVNTNWPYEEMTLPLPFLNVGFPKVGSNSLQNYFRCLGLNANHGQNGFLMVKNLAKGVDIYKLRGIKSHAYTQLDSNFGQGFYPQITLLDELHEVDPNSTFFLNFRPIHDWINSVKEWHLMIHRMRKYTMPGLILTPEQVKANNEQGRRTKPPLSKIQMAKWWCGHVLHIREYVKEYSSHALIELDLYDSNGTASLLYDLLQVDTNA